MLLGEKALSDHGRQWHFDKEDTFLEMSGLFSVRILGFEICHFLTGNNLGGPKAGFYLRPQGCVCV